MRTLTTVACLIALCGAAQGQTHRHLFLDPGSIGQASGVSLRVNPPQTRQIVIRPDRPWEQLMITFYLTLLDEDGRLRMWYVCRDRENRPAVAYAESNDGLHWTKPNLGLVERDGSKDNNLVNLTSLEGGVFRDLRAPPEQRYVYLTHVFGEGMVRFHSPDGLRWQRDAAPLLRFGADTQNVVLWDEQLGKYAVYLRGWFRGADGQIYRRVVRAALPDLTTPLTIEATRKSLYLWKQVKLPVITFELPSVFAADQQDPPNSDVYTISAQLYPLDPTWYLGFPSFFQRERSTSDGRLEVQVIGSRDGIAWHRYDRKPYVAPGPVGSESQNMAFIGPGMAIRGDEIWQYGTGFHSRHGDVEARKRKTDGVIYRYVQRVDGFVSLDFDDAEGRCVTEPATVDGSRLLLNLDTGALGRLRVGLQTTDGKAIPGFDTADCQTLRMNSTSAEVQWTGGSDLASLNGQKVRLVFVGARAKLYSYRFQ